MTSTADDVALLRFSRRAMATVFEVVVPWGTADADALAQSALNEIDHLEDQLTVYRPDSEVSRLNRIAAQAPVPVETHLYDLLKLCQRLSDETAGAFDITAGPLIKAWGFFRRQGRVPGAIEITDALANVGMSHVMLDNSQRRIRFKHSGVEINLGSIGKGYALDRIASSFRARSTDTAALFHGGTSSVLAQGGPWPVGVKHPSEPRRLGTLHLTDRAMASSGATHQHFVYNGKAYGHLLDPRSGQPATGVSLAVAVASSGAEADALATAFYVMGLAATRRYCAEHPQARAILLIDEPGAVPDVINLPANVWTPAGPDEWYDPVAPEDA